MFGTVLTVLPLVTDSVHGEPGYDFGASSSEIDWDTEEPLETEDGIELTCAKGHHWWSLGAPEPPTSITQPKLPFPEGDTS